MPAAFVPLDAAAADRQRQARPPRPARPRTDAPPPPATPAPRTPAEQAIAAIWADVLGTAQVGIDDNFFELGGDSILSIQVVSRARQAGPAFTAKDLFLHQTIAELAPRGHHAPPPPAPPLTSCQPAPPRSPRSSAGSSPGSPRRSSFPLHHVDAPAGAGRSRRRALSAAIDAVVTHHDALRLRFFRLDGQWRQEPATSPAGLLGTAT